MDQSFEELFTEYLEFTAKTFEHATSLSSIAKLEEETREVKYAIITNDSGLSIEYTDCMGCILDSAMRKGVTIEDIKSAFRAMIDKCKSRSWKLNTDGTYKHISGVEVNLNIQYEKYPLLFERIIKAVGKVFDMTPTTIRRKTKVSKIVDARAMTVYLMYNQTETSYGELEDYMKTPKHTIQSAARAFNDKLKYYEGVEDKYKQVLKILGLKHKQR